MAPHLQSGLAAGLQPSGNAALSSCTCCTLVTGKRKTKLGYSGSWALCSALLPLGLTSTDGRLSGPQTRRMAPDSKNTWQLEAEALVPKELMITTALNRTQPSNLFINVGPTKQM